ncbi:MAG TPA: OsmC family peroxiredoxin [Gaiellaceae bacterium]|jgi:osmotically inducible protein OsmC|nr:OsmC family peroxiredoxin [Gaiellaceae bacterium]
MAVERSARATWEGDLMEGSGEVSTASGVIRNAKVTWSARAVEADENTSPEELIAAAHATCVSMALANGLAQAGTPAKRLESDATATFDQTDEGFRLTTMDLSIRGEVEGLDEEGFRRAAEEAAENCPVSQALKGNVEVALEASLAG